MKRRPLLLLLASALAALATATLLLPSWDGEASADVASSGAPPRIVSLMPPVTETLYEIGAGDQLAGISDYCRYPAQLQNLPACGSALTPNSEAIVKLQPTLILANSSEATARDDLRRLGRTVFLPWLTAEEMIDSTRRLGELTGRRAQADALSDRLSAALLRPAPEDGPRVLLLMLPQQGKLEPLFFLRRNSVHGRMLHAAGGRNAVAEDVTTTPEISVERVIALDPDMIIMVSAQDDVTSEARAALLSELGRLTPLSAVRSGRIGIVAGSHFYGAGGRLLRAIDELRAEIERLTP
jgi:ABC-type Fe3+-hydroxamate transport system substrate-binding protein